MKFLTLSALPLLFGVSAIATPLEVRDDSANVHVFSGDTCNGASNTISVVGSPVDRCVEAAQGRRSIYVTGSGCEVKTWSGTNCQGSSFLIKDSACHSVLYGSFSIKC